MRPMSVTIVRRALLLLMSAIVAATQWACMGACDLFVPTKPVRGGYVLMREEGGLYLLSDGRSNIGSGGVLHGIVQEIGWNEHYIVGSRFAMSSNVRSGWMIINVKTGEIRGPYTAAEFAEVRRCDPSLLSIKILPVHDAWNQLD